MNLEKRQTEKLKNLLEALKPRSPAWRELIEKHEAKIYEWFAKWHRFLIDAEIATHVLSYFFMLNPNSESKRR